MPTAIADAGPPHYLVQVGQVRLLPILHGLILMPSTVARELSHARTPPMVRRLIARPPNWLQIIPDPPTPPVVAAARLDPGERAALSAAFGADQPLLLTDDDAARRFAARRGIARIGTLGILVEAAAAGLLDLDAVLADLAGRTNFRLTPDLVDAARAKYQERRGEA